LSDDDPHVAHLFIFTIYEPLLISSTKQRPITEEVIQLQPAILHSFRLWLLNR